MTFIDRSAICAAPRLAKFLTRVAVVPILLALGACQHIAENEGKPATGADVVSQIKSDIGAYQTYDAVAAAAETLAAGLWVSISTT
ncbi:hypothetical protein AWB78_03928 [Caballeronia calidae]|uniref:Lipoprotein n=1 Tax=Caballeronia calidae TaxID=1777139 RepID=A0A158CH50_9BURK|nr:hypothetical protein [Caballeronia calidae]SAK81600.1 hypothetical protein AWB78_03928 [Caballeronia calidae]